MLTHVVDKLAARLVEKATKPAKKRTKRRPKKHVDVVKEDPSSNWYQNSINFIFSNFFLNSHVW